MTPVDSWGHGLSRLTAWTEEHGHARVPQRFVEPDGFRLGKWVHNARSAYRARSRTMTDERIAVLERLPGWTWKARRSRDSSSGAAASDRPAAQPLPVADFDEQVGALAAARILRAWCTDRARSGGPVEFTEQMLADDAAFQQAVAQEAIRVSIAALVAVGQVRALTSEGAVLSWADLLTPARMDPGWLFQSLPGHPSTTLVPTDVLAAYEQIVDQTWQADSP